MGDNSEIQWTDATWNPVRGCSRISAGCGGPHNEGGCYAERVAHRFSGPGQPYEGLTRLTANGPRWTGDVRLVPEMLDQPLRWKRPRRIFVNSMSDLFHEKLSDEDIDRVFAVMALAPWHTFQILTKRPERMREYMTRPVSGPWAGRAFRDDSPMTAVDWRMSDTILKLIPQLPASAINRSATRLDRFYPEGDGFHRAWPLPNCWLGVSVENQETVNERIPLLLETPAAVRFLSCEPLLGPIDLSGALTGDHPGVQHLGWVIVGGESGPNARPMHPQWARDIRNQCVAAGVPYFFKQWGEWAPAHEHKGPLALALVRYSPNIVLAVGPHEAVMMARAGKKNAGHLLDGREWNEMPEARS